MAKHNNKKPATTNAMPDTLSTLVIDNPVTDTTESTDNVTDESTESIVESAGDVVQMMQESDRAENLGATTAEEHNAMIGHNDSEAIEIPKLTDEEITSAVADLKLAKATAKGEISAIRTRIYLAELRLLIPAMEQAYTFRNSNFLVKLVSGAGLSGPIKRALSMTISNLINVKDGRLVLDPNKTPLTHVSEKTGALLPVWDESRWKFLKQVYAIEVARGVDPISDSWNDVFPSPEKSLTELREGFAAQIKTMGKKGLTLQDMMTILQAKLAEGNLTE